MSTKNSSPATQAPPSDRFLFWKLFAKATALSLLITLVLLLLTAIVIGGAVYKKVDAVFTDAGYSLSSVWQTAQRARKQSPLSTDQYKNVLILGVDSLETRPGSPPLADTIVLASLHLPTARVNILSLPRDLWSSTHLTKINALYTYGIERNPDKPAEFPKQVIEEMTGVPIHHTLVVTMDMVSASIDAVGGVDVTIDSSFTDTQFPRSDVDVTKEHDPAKLYKTVSFEKGIEHMNGARALEYIRSRHAEGTQGTDNARSSRQQQVINAVIARVRQRDVLTNPAYLTALLKLYKLHVEPQVPLDEAMATAFAISRTRTAPQIAFHLLPIYPEDDAGVITHPSKPSKEYTNQWVYVIRDPAVFTQFVQSSLHP